MAHAQDSTGGSVDPGGGPPLADGRRVALAPIAWDGHARVDYVPAPGRSRPERGRLQVRLTTIEPTSEAEVRPGLRCAFVASDLDGPPTFIGAALRGRRLGDLRDLLGARLSAVADEVVAGPARSRWTRLDLRAVDALASSFAPYRDRVFALAETDDGDEPDPRGADDAAPRPAPVPRAGTWEHGLWALFADEELRGAYGQLRGAQGGTLGHGSGVAGDEPAPAEPVRTGSFPLPSALAAMAGLAPELAWELVSDGLVRLRARPVAGGGERPGVTVEVSFDDGAGRWAALEADADGTLTAEIASAANADRLPPVRLRLTFPGQELS